MILLYKNKGDIQNCNNYRGIKLLSHTMKVWEDGGDKGEEDCGNIHESICIHVGTFNCRSHSFRKDMYDGAKIQVRTMGGDSEHFPI